MAIDDDIANKLKQNAQGPISVRGDSGEVTLPSLDDQIKADRYTKSNAAMKSGKGMRFTKLIPPGSL